MFNFLKSKKRLVIEDLAHLYRGITVSTAMLERTSPGNREDVAWCCRRTLLNCPRGQAGLDQLDRIIARTTGKDTMRFAAAALVRSIVEAAHEVRTKLDASDRPEAWFLCAAIQAQIEAFMKRNGVPGWGVQYYCVGDFEALVEDQSA